VSTRVRRAAAAAAAAVRRRAPSNPRRTPFAPPVPVRRSRPSAGHTARARRRLVEPAGRPPATMRATEAAAAAAVLEDTVLYRYEMCRNMSAEAATDIPLCVNGTALLDYDNDTDDEEILQVRWFVFAASSRRRERFSAYSDRLNVKTPFRSDG